MGDLALLWCRWTADNITAFTLAVSGDRTLEFILVDSGEYGNCSVIVDLKFEQFPSWPAQIIYCVIGFFVVCCAGSASGSALRRVQWTSETEGAGCKLVPKWCCLEEQ